MKTIIIVLFTSALFQPALAEIIEIQKMAEILPSIAGKKALVVFDIDNTILEPKQTLGSDQWYDYWVGVKQSQGLTEEQAIQDWTRIQKKTGVKLVESVTPQLIENLKRNHEVIILTARPNDLIEVTRRQLQSLGVSIADLHAIGSGISKGSALAKIIQGKMKDLVIFVDDKNKNIESVNQSLNHVSGLKHIEFRYGAADPRVKNFSAAVANCQWKAFSEKNILVSDQKCR